MLSCALLPKSGGTAPWVERAGQGGGGQGGGEQGGGRQVSSPRVLLKLQKTDFP